MKNMTGYLVPNPNWRKNEEHARKERQIRDMKDANGQNYMGKNE